MEKHVTFVAALNIGFGFLGVIFAIIVFVAIVGGGIISQDTEAIKITSLVGTIIGGVMFLLSLPGLIGGFGLLKRKPWARILILIVSCLDLLFIPIGTAIGIYGLWVLLQDETTKLFIQNK